MYIYSYLYIYFYFYYIKKIYVLVTENKHVYVPNIPAA